MMTNEQLMVLKNYLETMTPFNHLASVEVITKWEISYKLVYEALNGEGSYIK
jgi:hypothetical protein